MKLTQLWNKTARVATALGLLSTSLATTASASHVRYKDLGSPVGGVRVVRSEPYYYREHHSSGAGAFLGGLVGGLVLGSVLSNATHARVEAQYVVEDPWSGYDYPSYDAYLDQCRVVDHPRIVRVIDVRTGQCVRTARWDEGRWVDTRWDGPYADYRDYGYGRTYDDRYSDRGWRDQRTWQRERGDDRGWCNDRDRRGGDGDDDDD